MTKDEQVEKEFELHRLYEGENPFESDVELHDRIAQLEADLSVPALAHAAIEATLAAGAEFQKWVSSGYTQKN